MSVIYLLIGASIVIATIFLFFFIWASKTGQFEDDYTPSIRILFEDKTTTDNQTNNQINGTGKI